MNTTIKQLYDCVVSQSYLLAELADKYNMGSIDRNMVKSLIIDADDALKDVPEYDRGNLGWKLPAGIEIEQCEGDTCKL